MIGYAMSRLDAKYLSIRGHTSWTHAYSEAEAVLRVKASSFKQLRDEFDPFQPNGRKGWHGRPIRPGRARVVADLSEISDDALEELVSRILAGDTEAVSEAVDALTVVRSAAGVAERLLTGRTAEDHFLTHSSAIVDIPPDALVDLRLACLGFDFGVRDQSELAIEVKGLKGDTGNILFTDREWAEARHRQDNYWLIVIGNLASEPAARLIPNPYASLDAHCRVQRSVTAAWQSRVSIL
ncbi:MAG: DUF3883 domain-containing protein [Capsulimonadaceae bacterium]